MQFTAHFFTHSGEAYDASQCDDRIKSGDLLIVPEEKVVGFLFLAWPIAVTQDAGVFHIATNEWPDEEDEGGRAYWLDVRETAQVLAKRLGYNVEAKA
jgi:hypothetical protein